MTTEKLTQIFFEDVMCFVDLENKVVYSAKLKKLKPQHLKRHINDYYMIKYNGKKSYKSIEQLMEIALSKHSEKGSN